MISSHSNLTVDDRARHRPDLPAQSPWNPTFTADVLEPLSRRHQAGESAWSLSQELYHIVHPWAMSTARAQSARLPAHADRQEVLSQVVRLTWEACLRIDWDRYWAWPAYLDSKVGRAGAEAARCDDWLSRQERVLRRQYHSELARGEQRLQRSLTESERRDIAQSVAPSSARVDWTAALLAARHPSTVGEVPDVAETTTLEELVEARELGRIRVRCLTDWLVVVAGLNARLAAELSRWSKRDQGFDHGLPARLAHRVEPYTPLLLAMLAEAA